MCVSVVVGCSLRSSNNSSRRSIGRIFSAASAMAPALTQATPHQRCCPNLTLLPNKKPKWPCGGGVNLKKSSCSKIARSSEELTRGGALDPAPRSPPGMGLHPTEPGDRMDLEQPPGKTPEWTDEDDHMVLEVIKNMEVLRPPVDKEAEVERRLVEAGTKQQQIEARCQTLLRRAGRLQSRHVGRHVADQVANFVAYAKETLSIGAKGRHTVGSSNLYGWAEDGRLPTREEVRNIPTATLVNLVSRLQAPPVSYLSNRRYFGLASQRSSNNNNNVQQQSSRPLSSQVAETLEEVAGLWEAQLRYLQRHDDPDATESSSGGESDDETTPPVVVEPPDSIGADGSPVHPAAPKPVSTYQRASWKWARDRAAVAARWSWLQAQVSDLEYRIRQHTDVYRQLRAAKGPVQFAPVNGLTSSSPTTTKDPADSEESSSRTRPLVHQTSGFRHRRLIKASQITAGSGRKSSRSTVRCCCVMSRIYHPCVLCNGKNNYLLPVDPDGMTLRERIGLTDRGFHPVLSLPQDIPLSAHVDSILKSGDWRPPPTQQSTPMMRMKRSKPEEETVKRKAANNKRKNVVEDGKLDKRKALLKRRKRAALSTDALDEDSGSFPSSPYTDSVPSTPGRPPGNNRNSVFHDLMRRRTSYDIDNIVIPYSMAATTRVERLQYKEIQTPKWRTVDEEELASAQDPIEEVEDVSEEACIARHDRSEVDERRKFMSYLKQPAGVTRGRRRVDQMDSRADQSSGANTPDPMSPSQAGSKTADGPEVDAEEGADPVTEFTASAIKERRRTASLTKRDSSVWKFVNDDNSGMSWDIDEFHTVAPYEPRQFPLSDIVYDQLVEEMPPEEEEEGPSKTRSSECGVPATVVISGATPTTTTTSSSTTVDDEAVTFISESTSSPGADDLEVDDEDPNDPEWEGSQGSAPRSSKK